VTVSIVSYADRYFEGVDALWKEVFPSDPPRNRAEHSIPKKLTVHPELLLVAVDGGNVFGAIMAGYDGHRGWLHSVAVLSAHQGLGIGTLLVREAERRLRALGCVKINLQVRSENGGVADFYRKLGYALEDRISLGKAFE
jgi:ribosomal protein S18 acetylase RimI-like enzyme